jgi:exodeoxyribonuclease VII large subunit
LSLGRRRHDALLERLSRQDPRLRLSQRAAQLADLRARLQAAARPLVARRRALLAEQAASLQALSPLSVLGRGYAIALSERTGKALLSARDASPGERLRLRLHDGQLTTVVEAEDDQS